jgi:uncharacterized protein (TIGR00251 family)
LDLEGVRIDPDGEGCRIGLRVKPGGRRDRVAGIYGDRLRVEVTAPPEKGKANEAVRALLARAFGVPRHAVEIVAGEASRDKTIRIALPPEAARERLAAI